MPERLPKQYGANFEPWLAQGDIALGFSNAGLSVVYATLAVNTGTMAAITTGLPAGSPHRAGGGTPPSAARSGGPVIHSLGVAPAAYWVTPVGGSDTLGWVTFAEVTAADNSAIYLEANTNTVGQQSVAYVRVAAIQ